MERKGKKRMPIWFVLVFIVAFALALATALLLPETIARFKYLIGIVLFLGLSLLGVFAAIKISKKR